MVSNHGGIPPTAKSSLVFPVRVYSPLHRKGRRPCSKWSARTALCATRFSCTIVSCPPLPHRVELPFHSFVNVGVRSLLHDDRLSLSTPFTRPSLPERVPDLVLLSVLSCPFYGVTATSLPVSAPRGASRRPLSSRQANSALPSHPWLGAARLRIPRNAIGAIGGARGGPVAPASVVPSTPRPGNREFVGRLIANWGQSTVFGRRILVWRVENPPNPPPGQ
jgi:hypothetical protein